MVGINISSIKKLAVGNRKVKHLLKNFIIRTIVNIGRVDMGVTLNYEVLSD